MAFSYSVVSGYCDCKKERYYETDFLYGVCAVQGQKSDLNVKFDASGLYQLTQQMYNHMRSFGYQAVELPIIEPADLFLIKAGDQIVDKLFTFEHQGIQLALRPEFTASAAYHYGEKYLDNPSVVRWQFSGYVFEDDPFAANGRNQNFSIGAELIGMKDIVADAEIIGMAAQGLAKQNIADYRVTLGHVGLLRNALAYFQLDNRTEHFLLNHIPALKDSTLGRAYVIEEISKLFLGGSNIPLETETQQIYGHMLETTRNDRVIGGRTHQDISRRLFQKYRRSADRSQILLAVDFLVEWIQIMASPDAGFPAIKALLSDKGDYSDAILSDWEKLVGYLEAYGIPQSQIIIQPGIIRSWDYYSGIVFEIGMDGIHLGGGGRYDGLGKLLGAKEDMSAVGFAYYVDALLSLSQSAKTDHFDYLIVASQLSIPDAIQWASSLRDAGLNIQIIVDASKYLADEAALLFIEMDGKIRFRGQSYGVDTPEKLINELKRNIQ